VRSARRVKGCSMNQSEAPTTVPLTPTQHGMLYHRLAAPRAGVDVEHVIGSLSESLDLSAFRRAWQRLVDRHEALRLRFSVDEKGNPRQHALERVTLSVDERDWSGLPGPEQDQRLDAYLEQDRARGFDPRSDTLIRVAVFRLGECEYRFVWTWWHGVLDGRARLILLRELFVFYEAFRQGHDISLPAPRPFTDYASWLAAHAVESQSYWRQLLEGVSDSALVPAARPAGPGGEGDFGFHEVCLSRPESDRLRAFATSRGVTVNALVQGAWALVLGHYGGQDDIVFGATRACRHSAFDGDGTGEAIVGVLINTLPVRVRIDPATPVVDWLQALRAQHLAVRPYENTPLVTVQASSGIRADRPLFETLVVFETQLLDSALRREGGNWEGRRFRIRGRAGLPLTLYFYADTESVVEVHNDRTRVDDESASRMLTLVVATLRSIADSPFSRLADLSLLPASERHQLLVDWNDTHADYPRDKTVAQLFEEQVTRTPQATAVVHGDESLTYDALNGRANRVAHCLGHLGVRPGVAVGICVERSLDMMVGLLGILKAGGAYVPLDPAFPRDRLAFMLTDSHAAVLLTETQLEGLLPGDGVRVVRVDDLPDEGGEVGTAANPDSLATPDDLAYVLYTSGSTGQPKGVEIPHRALTNFLWAMRAAPGCTAQDVLLAVTTLSFDIAGLELYLPLIVGARVDLVSRTVASDGRLLRQRLERVRPTLLQATPATWRILIEAGWSRTPGLTALCGGEALPADLVQPLLDRTAALWNMYGPTETTIWSSVQRVTSAEAEITVGRPIANTTFYILDKELRPVATGVPGELFIGGDGLARGYRSRPALTAEKFIAHPFSTSPGARLYRTGDLARYRWDGQVVHLGRLDYQVKIRGFRIELGEIETTLMTHEAVAQAVVAAREDQPGGATLAAYVIPAAGRSVASADLRQHLRRTLPDYMVPQWFVEMGAFPLTPNGKIDRKQLPAPDRGQPGPETGFVAPRNPTEVQIAAIFGDVLQAPRVGVHDNFFDLGGHSLQATRLMARLADAFHIELPLRSLFDMPTVAELSVAITQRTAQQEDEETVAALLADLEGLTADEVQALLADQPGQGI
jgi:amino acid adenylation domain-containing protein